MFVLFGLWTVRGDSISDEESNRAQKATGIAFFVVTSAFVLAELGDKTMLATITLAADHNWLGVWIGSTIGMVAADALAILVGAVAGKHLPERTIQLGAAASVPTLRRLHDSGEHLCDGTCCAHCGDLGRHRRPVGGGSSRAPGAVAPGGDAA